MQQKVENQFIDSKACEPTKREYTSQYIETKYIPLLYQKLREVLAQEEEIREIVCQLYRASEKAYIHLTVLLNIMKEGIKK